MKKIITKSIGLILAMVMLGTCGCGGSDSASTTAAAEATSTSVTTEAAKATEAAQTTEAPKTTEAAEEKYVSAETEAELLARLADTKMIDVRESTATQLVSEQYLLHMTVMKDIAVVDGEIYYIQRMDSAPSDLVIQHIGEDGFADSYMNLMGFGSGTCFNAEKAADGSIYFWVSSNGGSSSTGLTLSRVKWEDGKNYLEQGDQTWYFGQTDGEPYAAIDNENGILCVRYNCTAGSRFEYYCLDDMIQGKDPAPIHTMETNMLTANLSADINPDKIAVGSYNFHGFAISGKYIYQYYGTAKQLISLAVYDMEGNACYVMKITAGKDLVYREADGICIDNGKLYFAITSGESSDRRANVFVFE